MGGRRHTDGADRLRWLRSAVVPGLLGVAAYYAVFGGEYSLLELHQARASVLVEQERLERERAEVDSLRVLAEQLERDPATIEKIAREEFGMIRAGETLYRITDAGDLNQRRPPQR